MKIKNIITLFAFLTTSLLVILFVGFAIFGEEETKEVVEEKQILITEVGVDKVVYKDAENDDSNNIVLKNEDEDNVVVIGYPDYEDFSGNTVRNSDGTYTMTTKQGEVFIIDERDSSRTYFTKVNSGEKVEETVVLAMTSLGDGKEICLTQKFDHDLFKGFKVYGDHYFSLDEVSNNISICGDDASKIPIADEELNTKLVDVLNYRDMSSGGLPRIQETEEGIVVTIIEPGMAGKDFEFNLGNLF